MIPSLSDILALNPDLEMELFQNESVTNSMTKYERIHPEKIDDFRRRRIAGGAGVEPSVVDRILKDFQNMSTIAEKMACLIRPSKRF